MFGGRYETGAPSWHEVLTQHGDVINEILARK